jgi:hypothetical protein
LVSFSASFTGLIFLTMKTISIILIAICFALVTSAQSEKLSSLDCIPVPAICYPLPVNSGGLGIGITFVSINQIQNTSGHTNGFFENYTCTDSAQLDIGTPYTFNVITGQTYEESVTAWIDFDNNGDFDPSEIVFHDSAMVFTHVGTVTIPSGVPNQNIPIRMRVGSDYSGTPLTGCNQPSYGEYEDYKVYYGIGNGVEENKNVTQVILYPNPFNTSATLFVKGMLNQVQQLVLNIYDQYGRLVKAQGFNSLEDAVIERGNLSEGFYFYEAILDGHEKALGKFLVQ